MYKLSKLPTQNMLTEALLQFHRKQLNILQLHSYPKLKLQPVLSLSSFVHNSSINEHKNMKLRESICYEIIN